MKKVLIVSHSFAPASNMGAKRFGIMCKYFKENGYECYVVTTLLLREYMDAQNGLAIPISSDHIYKIRDDRTNRGWIAFALKFFDDLKLSSRTVESSLFWHKNVKKNLDLAQLQSIGFDFVIGTYGPIANLLVARYLSKKLRCRYVADIRDLISDYAEKPYGYKRTFKLDYMIEKAILYSADGIMTVNRSITRDMRKRFPGKKVVTVYNGWDGEVQENIGDSSEKYLYFAGAIYDYMLDGLRLLFRSLKVVNEQEDIRMFIRCISSNTIKVKKMIREIGVQEIVSCLPPVSENIVREERQKAYINVVLNSINEKDYEAMTLIFGKTYEYMHEKAPVLGITLKESDLAKVLRYTDKGVGTDIEAEIIEFILYAGNNFKGNDKVLKFSRQYQTARLCRFLDYLLK